MSLVAERPGRSVGNQKIGHGDKNEIIFSRDWMLFRGPLFGHQQRLCTSLSYHDC